MVKKLIALFMVVLLTAGCFAACSDSSDKENEDSSTDSTVPTPDETNADTGGQTPDGGNEDDGDGGDNGEDDGEEDEVFPTRYKLTADTEGVKVLGVRNLPSENSLHMDWTCSGAEFTVDLEGETVLFNFTVSADCYFRVWIDGEKYVQNGSEYLTVNKNTGLLLLNGLATGKHTIRIMKVTDYTLALAELTSVTFAGRILTDTDTADKELYVEFVGDSTACGWGTVGEQGGAYTDQDGSLAYPYLLAEALDADYSITALSDQGLLCGDPGVSSGYLYASPMKDSANEYDFERKADIVVINIGTSDYSKNVGEAEFKAAYLSFLRTVREKNGDGCKILCLYNAVNDTYANAILAAVETFGGAQMGAFAYKLDRAENNAYPNISEHAAYAEALEAFIAELPESFVPSLTVVPEGDGDADYLDFPAN